MVRMSFSLFFDITVRDFFISFIITFDENIITKLAPVFENN